MTRDRSLDEFFGGGDAAESDAAESAADDADANADESGDEDVDPASLTYRWTPEGAACESCGRVVERRWADDDDSDDSESDDDGDGVGFVCDDCKKW